ncbi:ribokinase-like domain-containing protein [Oscillochloris trichoides DG-6]|uniref:Ribokinase-like domain-containing protein n=1 Tax=Oscillochloris trichoides DG-6 TaxID=765420 RepID=E1IA90_9CHLR|nr:PfkB family carbohydrate kinase [Oscillochloris trichoides]EFO81844.1 ribokinase-like domain-containing protein [Oscillochloris trichoides DG-6]
MTTPTYLVIGDLTRDLLPDGSSTMGGTALYAAATAAWLGVTAAIFTSGNPAEPPVLPTGIEVALVPCRQPSTFENRYTPQGRLQLLHARGAALQIADLPPAWREAPLVHLGPLTGEFGLDLAAAFPNALVAVTPQGWMRHWELPLPAPIQRVPWQPDPAALAHVDLLVLSIEDVGGDEALVAQYAQHCHLVALTRGARGSTLYIAGTPHAIPAYPAEERDPTGAGDVFAAALLIHLHQCGDPLVAAAFASSVAAYAVEGRGITNLPTWEQAMVRMHTP